MVPNVLVIPVVIRVYRHNSKVIRILIDVRMYKEIFHNIYVQNNSLSNLRSWAI